MLIILRGSIKLEKTNKPKNKTLARLIRNKKRKDTDYQYQLWESDIMAIFTHIKRSIYQTNE